MNVLAVDGVLLRNTSTVEGRQAELTEKIKEKGARQYINRIIIWLSFCAGDTLRMAHSDWFSERAIFSRTVRSDIQKLSPQAA